LETVETRAVPQTHQLLQSVCDEDRPDRRAQDEQSEVERPAAHLRGLLAVGRRAARIRTEYRLRPVHLLGGSGVGVVAEGRSPGPEVVVRSEIRLAWSVHLECVLVGLVSVGTRTRVRYATVLVVGHAPSLGP